jgi:hypothetical protein
MNNLVAKYSQQFNKATVQRDKKNDYNRKVKHKRNNAQQKEE